MATERTTIKKNKTPKIRFTLTTYVIIGSLLVFGVMSGLLFQHSMIAERNTEILALQKTLDAAILVNDSKAGQLVTNMDLQSIEAQARGYGMTEPTQEQYLKEVVPEPKETSTVTDTEKVKSWFENLFNL